MSGILWVVATPLGNLGDLDGAGRREEVLCQVTTVYAEDTRRSRILLDHLGARPRLVSLHAHNERERAGEVVVALQNGERWRS